ncbi:MAG: hypothetical protein GY714_23535 [Desulfobacterales bacterium]|nr:hypothetical protein [Desulfobacterales bacterium]
MDNIDKNVYKQIQERKQTKEPYENTFSKLYSIGLSNTEARKELAGIEKHLEYKMEIEGESTENEDLPKYNESEELCADGKYKSDKLLKMSKEQSKDVDYLLNAHGFDNKCWQIVNARNNTWNVYSKKDGVQQLYSSKITVKPIIPEYDVEWAKEVFKEIKPLPPVKLYKNNKGSKIVELQYADIHIGLRGLEYEDELNKMTDEIINEYKDADVFILPIGQDLLNANHSNGANLTTLKGTAVEQSLSYREMFKSGLRVVCHILDRIIENTEARIECIYVPGNHDEQSCFGVFQSVMQRYLNNKNIIFDDVIKPRKYRLYGVNGIGFGHGQGEGKRIFGRFSVEAPEIFAKAKCREFHLTHLHNESVKDENGIIFRRMPTVNSPDNWHDGKGYTGATKRIQAFRYNAETGLKGIDYFYL